MTVKLALRGLRGESFADVARRVGSFGGLTVSSTATDGDVLGLLENRVAQLVEAGGLSFIANVRAATTANITLSGAQTIDGVAVVAGNRVLVKDQTAAAANGIYVAAAGAWSRATDFNETAEVKNGSYVLVTEGTAWGDSAWVLATADPVTVGTTALSWTQFRPSAQGAFTDPSVVGDLTLADGAVVVPETLPIRIGTNAMPSLGAAGTYNFPGASIAIGRDAGFSNVEGGVTAVGWEAGYFAGAVGDESAITAMGWRALKATTTGHATGFGWAAGQRNTTGHIVAVGDESLGFNTTGQSVAVGYYAGHSNVTGDVTAIGYQAGRFCGVATAMTLVGYNAGLYNTGAAVTAVGHRAAENNAGTENSAFGHQALFSNTTGTSSVAVGHNVLFENTTGFEHVAIGANAGRSVTTGYQCIFIGKDAGFNVSQKVDAFNSIAIGTGAYNTEDNQVIIGNSATAEVTIFGHLGVNAGPNPLYPLDVRAEDGASTVAGFRTGAGFGVTIRINDGVDTSAYGANYRHALQVGTGESLALVEGSTPRLVMESSTGRIGIATLAPEYALDVAGPIGFTPGSSVTPAQNGDVVFELTSDTSLTVKAKGSDGVVRSVVLTLA